MDEIRAGRISISGCAHQNGDLHVNHEHRTTTVNVCSRVHHVFTPSSLSSREPGIEGRRTECGINLEYHVCVQPSIFRPLIDRHFCQLETRPDGLRELAGTGQNELRMIDDAFPLLR